jgi:CYTH domain-containing protein
MMQMASRMPGAGRYSKLEREQRWVLGAAPSGLGDPIEISDVYVRHTDLRLRRMESEREVIWKLGQKVRVRPASPEMVRMTNLYLEEREYEVLRTLEGAPLVKTRWHRAWAQHVLSVDVFHGRLEGLVLAETELGPDEAPLGLPAGAVAEVTQDDRFSGGALAWLPAADARRLVADVARPSERRIVERPRSGGREPAG